MKLDVLSIVAVSGVTLIGAHDSHARHRSYIQRRDQALARQNAPVPSIPRQLQSVDVEPPIPVATDDTSVGVKRQAAAPVVTTPTVAGSFIPPLAQITSGAPVEMPLSPYVMFSPGLTPAYSRSAPRLPSLEVVINKAYPTPDHIPPVNSTEVQQWLSEIDLTGIPNLSLTKTGSCDGDPDIAKNTSRCWWTCGGCTRPSDVVACPDKYAWGVSFDDGPSDYSPKLINYLHDHNITATFFVVGSRVVSRPELLQTEYMSGHQISVHTWSHPPLTTLTNEEIVAELGWTRQAIKDVLGVSPTTMRPPYGDIDDRVRAVSLAMGLTPIIWTGSGDTEFDTDDWRIPGGQSNGKASFAAWQKLVGLANTLDTGFITLEHDLFQQEVDMAVGYILPNALSTNPPFKLSSVIECLHEPMGNAYAETTTATANTSSGNNGTATVLGGSSGTSSGGSASQSSKPNSAPTGISGSGSLIRGIGAVTLLATQFLW